MLTRVHVKNFRSLADVTVDLSRTTVLVGRNGAGKSTLLDALSFVSEAVTTGLDAAITSRGGITALRKWTPRGRPLDIEISLDLQDTHFRGSYGFVVGGSKDGDYRVKRETCTAQQDDREASSFTIRSGKWEHQPAEFKNLAERHARLRPAEIEPTRLMLPAIWFLADFAYSLLFDEITQISLYRVFPNTLREPQKPLSDYPMQPSGANMASVLRTMQQRKTQGFHVVREALRGVVDGVTDVRVRQVGGFLVTELKHERMGDSDPWFPLSQESDGTLRVLGLLVALYQEPPRRVVALEEPELAVHPGALTFISDTLREASQRSQVLLTTQSPDLISSFMASDLRVVERCNGMTSIGPVSQAQRSAIEQQLFSAGDLLRVEGLYQDAEPVTA